MPWCPKCRRFQEEDDLCAYCWVETVPELGPEAETPESKTQEVLLVTVSDEYEADLIQALLESHDILTLRKYRESGQYLKVYMGVTRLGIDIYVLENQLQEAMELINSEIAESSGTCDENGINEKTRLQEDKLEFRRQMAQKLTWVILIPLLIGILISLVYLFLNIPGISG